MGCRPGDARFGGDLKPFLINEEWMSRLWLPAAPAALLFSGAFYLMLPLAAPAAYKAAAALLLGLAAALAMLVRHKFGHLRRHELEALCLGFSCRVSGSLWNPFGRAELVLEKAAGDPEEDRLLCGLVRMSGPDYGAAGHQLAGAGSWAAICAACIAPAMGALPYLKPALLPLFSMAALVFLLAAAETALEKFEQGLAAGEGNSSMREDSCYQQWNFLSLEAKRKRMGRIGRMEADIRRILLGEAGLAAGSSVLELGAGGGFLWRHLPEELKPGWTQAEKDPYAALYARRHGYGARFCAADVKSLPFEDASFDAVAGLECFDSLKLEDFALALPEAMRLLKPGGRLVHLKDFPDWPGERLVDMFNAFAMRVLGLKPVCRKGLTRIKYQDLPAQDVTALIAAAGKEGPLVRAHARVLCEIYSAGPGSDPRFSVPMFVSALVLREAFRAAGFEIAADCFGAGETGVMAYVVARKPA